MRRQRFNTGFSELDNVYGGIDPGFVLELWGPSGSGKTIILMQVVAQSLLPESCGGEERHVVLIDVDGKFSVEQVAKMIRHIARRRGVAVEHMGDMVQECLSCLH